MHVDLRSLEVSGLTYAHQSTVVKRSGATVRTDSFAIPGGAPGISAVLYSCTDALNRPPTLGGDFVVVHNPHARAPVPHGFLPCTVEFFADGGAIHSKPGSLARDV